MKKILFFITICFTTINTVSAQFSLTPKGFINLDSPDKNYVVYEFEGKNQHEIYDAAMAYLFSIYVNPDMVLSSSNNSSITINALSTSAIQFAKKVYCDIRYSISLQIKDGKLRINAPHVVSMRNTALNMNCFIQGRELFYKTCVFNLKGKLLNEMALHSLESFFEKYISDLLDGIQTQNNSDEW